MTMVYSSSNVYDNARADVPSLLFTPWHRRSPKHHAAPSSPWLHTSARLVTSCSFKSLIRISDGNSSNDKRKLRALCLHGFRTSGKIMHKQLAKWGNAIEDIVEMSFLDAPFPAKGRSEVEGFFTPPYYEWFQYNKEMTEYIGLEECFDYITNYMKEHGPFDGFIGFSQGAATLCALVGLQEKGLALHGLPHVRFVIAISGCKLQAETMQIAYLNSIKCPSLHFLGERDWLKVLHEDLIDAFHEPIVIKHPQAHTVPRLSETSITTLKNFLACNSFNNHEKDVLHSFELEHEAPWIQHSLKEEDKMHKLVDTYV